MPRMTIDKDLIHKELGMPYEVIEQMDERMQGTLTGQAKKLIEKREGTYKKKRYTGEKTTKPITKVVWIEKIHDALETPRDKVLFLSGILLGMRVSDTIKLTYGQLKEKSGYAIEKKTDKTKTFYVNKFLRDAVVELGKEKGLKDEDYLFLSRKWKSQMEQGKDPFISTTQAYRILEKAGKKVRYPHPLSCHTLRKTFARTLYDNGAPLAYIMTMMNHSSEKQTLDYIGVTSEEIKKYYQKMDTYYKLKK